MKSTILIIEIQPDIEIQQDHAARLEAEGFENQGAARDDNLLFDFEAAGECADADDAAALKRFRRLASRRWAKWFFTDTVGKPVMICVAPWDRP